MKPGIRRVDTAEIDQARAELRDLVNSNRTIAVAWGDEKPHLCEHGRVTCETRFAVVGGEPAQQMADVGLWAWRTVVVAILAYRDTARQVAVDTGGNPDEEPDNYSAWMLAIAEEFVQEFGQAIIRHEAADGA